MKRALLVVTCVWVSATTSFAAESAKKPNVIVIVGDDMGYHDVGCQGCKEIPTPNIDSLAKNGVRCSSGYVSGPYCSPTRAGLLTGRYQQRFGHEFNPGPPTDKNVELGLSLKEKTLADRLKDAGYATGMVGKWHLGHAEKFNPISRGFQEYFGFLGGANSYQGNAKNPKIANIVRGTQSVEEKEYLTDAFAREAVAFIDRHSKEPFFLYLTFNAVHTPMQAAEKYLKRFESIKDDKRRTYAGMMSAMDDAVGSVLKKLDQAKIEENTLIFFISDNGGPPVNASDNTPLNGHKASTWEGGIRVPYLVQWKGKLQAGKVYDAPIIQLDIAATALAAAGAPAPADAKLDGVNLVPYFEGKLNDAPHKALYWRFGQQRAVRMGDWKLTQVRNSEPMLFNLAKDIGEKEDLAKKEPAKLKELEEAYSKWNADLVAPTWGPPRAQAKKKAVGE